MIMLGASIFKGNPVTRLLAKLRREYLTYHSHTRDILKWAGIVGAVGFPLFYALHLLRNTKSYDNLWLRLIGALLLLALALRDYWPQRLRPYYLAWSYGAFLYCLPFFFIFMSLKNGGGSVSVANTFMAVFFLILLTDWRNTVVMMVLGASLATVCYIASTPDPAMPVDYLGRLPPLILVIIGGSTFKFSQKQIEAERLDAATALAGSIAHEMRNPLGQIRHSLESLRQSLPAPTAKAQAQVLRADEANALYRDLAQADIAVERGLQVISMTLDEVSAKPLNSVGFAYISAAAACSKAVLEYGYESHEQRHRVNVDVVGDFLFRGEETAFLFVLFNLIKNALYYLPAYPRARVVITVDNGTVKVRDTGPGISEDLQRRLFEPFRTSKSGGTGLGLAYCRRVMRGFGGEITCQSVQGEYTEFTLSFPPVSVHEREVHRQAVIDKAKAVFVRRRLLVVDDDAALRKSTRLKLAPVNAVIDEAADGRQALAMLSNFRYDLMVLDLNMPGIDGYAVAQQVRSGQVPNNRDVCIVAHTSEPGLLARVKTLKAGMDGLVNKPCDQEALLRALCQALEHPAGRARLEHAQLAGQRVLLADDNAYSRKAVAAYLRRAGVEVAEADTGESVMAQLNAGGEAWDAILMDINMPGMSGLDTAQAIRASNMAWRDVPIVALTAHSSADMMAAARSAGMGEFLTKPVDAAVLYGKLRQLTSREPAALVAPPAAAPRPDDRLLDVDRLERYREIGMLEELVGDYVPEIARLVERLDAGAGRNDLDQCEELLHSLVGLSGEAGAVALHRLTRQIYAQMTQDHRLPAQAGWVEPIGILAAQSTRALNEYAGRRDGAA
jgi:two-component system, CAI-1 autoinducer sensor kinase/phosphatase CqsS